ncbi:hypothetical protein E5P55_00540 [Candidatus Pinguicoccus supinus]|uniref:Alanyl-tRNA synthetase class IIc N-terminal domain-containing protein n=1 Tax=Candidatus Pinguicoccus supinus TaxID=2529394 RepID=A0A7T0FYE6_9BACT|nr:hypothetical protein E5P55_00540 [Candidatus Pinguicoccus supinus]
MKFFIEKGKKIYSLNKFFVDTGLGLERLIGIFNSTFVFKNFTSLKYSNYRGKLYRKYLIFLKNILKIKANYQTRILIDHISTSIELLNAGINVSNSGRGFILKKLIRRLLFYFISYKINFQTINSILKRYSLESNKINAYNRCTIVFKNEYFSLINFEKNAKDFLLKLILKNKTIKKDWTEFVYFVYQTHGLKLIFLKNHINLHRTFIN